MGDCDDLDPEEFPGNVEDDDIECFDGLDQDCDGQLDADDPSCWGVTGSPDDDDASDDDDAVGDDDDATGEETPADDDDGGLVLPEGGEDLDLPEDELLPDNPYPGWGCGCSTGGGVSAGWSAVLLLLVGARRRRS